MLEGTGQPGLSAGASGGIMGIGAALLIAALFKISVNGMVLNLRSLIFIMGINLIYGFAVPGIDNAGHIGGAVTGLVIALAFAIAHRQRMAAMLQNVAIYQNPYQNNDQKADPNNDEISNITHSTGDDMYSDTVSNNVAYLNSDMHINAIHNSVIEQKPPAFIWQLLPWLMILLISIGFVWWWQDIHQQILQVLKTIE